MLVGGAAEMKRHTGAGPWKARLLKKVTKLESGWVEKNSYVSVGRI